MRAIRKAILSFGMTLFGLTIAFTIMAYDMPGVYPGLSEIRAFVAEKLASQDRTEMSSLQSLRERNATLPVEAQGPGAPIGAGSIYGILDVFRTMQIFLPNDTPIEPLRTRPGQHSNGARLPTIGETRPSNNVLLGTY